MEGEAGVGAKVGTCNAADIKVWILLSSVEAPLTSLSLPLRKRLQ